MDHTVSLSFYFCFNIWLLKLFKPNYEKINKTSFLQLLKISEAHSSYTDILNIQRILEFLPLGQDPNQISQSYVDDYLLE